MKVLINNIEYEYIDDVVENTAVQTDFIELIRNTFGFDFEKWKEEGYWTYKYEPHVLVKENQVVATVTVNHMKYMFRQEKTYIQLGGVLTRKEYRNRGLGRWLIEQIVSRYENQCDQIFLLSNDSAVNFYPKFGFVRAVEYIAEYEWKKETGISKSMPVLKARKLNMDFKEDRELLLNCYRKSNPFSKFTSIQCEELLFFYAMGVRKDCMYYFSDMDAVAFAKFKKTGLVLEDIYGADDVEKEYKKDEAMKAMIDTILTLNEKQEEEIAVRLGFSPIEGITDLTISPLEEKDDTLYILQNKENLFEENKLRFPVLSHN